jgi:hypothetical protein
MDAQVNQFLIWIVCLPALITYRFIKVFAWPITSILANLFPDLFITYNIRKHELKSNTLKAVEPIVGSVRTIFIR